MVKLKEQKSLKPRQEDSEFFRKLSELKQENKELRENLMSLNAALSAGGIGHWEMSLRNGHMKFSPSFASLLGFHVNELEPSFDAIVDLTHPNDLDFLLSKQIEFLATPGARLEVSYRMRDKHGVYRWFQNFAYATSWDELGRPLLIAGVSFLSQLKIPLRQYLDPAEKIQSILV